MGDPKTGSPENQQRAQSSELRAHARTSSGVRRSWRPCERDCRMGWRRSEEQIWPWVKSRPPVNIPIPTKIGSKMGGAPAPNIVPWVVSTHSHLVCEQIWRGKQSRAHRRKLTGTWQHVPLLEGVCRDTHLRGLKCLSRHHFVKSNGFILVHLSHPGPRQELADGPALEMQRDREKGHPSGQQMVQQNVLMSKHSRACSFWLTSSKPHWQPSCHLAF